MVIVTTASGGTVASHDPSLLQEIISAQEAVEELGNEMKRSMSGLHDLQDRFEKAVKKQQKTLRSASKMYGSSSSNAPEQARVSTNSRIASVKRRLKELEQLMPASGGVFVQILLGSLNVRFVRKSERLGFKEEYEKLKMKLAPCLVVLCIICMLFEENRWIHMMLQLALAWYYVTLAVRENILRVNGSNIKAWWIIHHYFTIMQAVLLLVWPDNESYARCRRDMHLFGLYNAILQIFQTRYQIARLYALRSLGMASEMDVASSDGTQIHWSEGMKLLLPLILFGQMLQARQAYTLGKEYRANPRELQILCLALLFLANFVGNFYTTLVVLNEKRKSSRMLTAARAAHSASLPGSSDNTSPAAVDEKKDL